MKFLFAFALFAVVAYVSANPLYGAGYNAPIYGPAYHAPLRVPLYNAPAPRASAAAAAAASASSTGVRPVVPYRNLVVPSYNLISAQPIGPYGGHYGAPIY